MDIMKRKSQCAEKSEKSSPISFFATFSTDSKSASNFDTHIAVPLDHSLLRGFIESAAFIWAFVKITQIYILN
jgi:hypothetical protein